MSEKKSNFNIKQYLGIGAKPLFIIGLLMIGLLSFQRASAHYYYYGVPYFLISSVDAGDKIVVQTFNFPPNQNFYVSMGYYGSYGYGEHSVSFNSGAGGSVAYEWPIPDSMKGVPRVAVRAQTGHYWPYYAYNWFWNVPPTSADGIKNPHAGNTVPRYYGNPTISINSVVRGQTVTVTGHNFPPNQQFYVMMNYFGSAGINGYYVETLDSGAGGTISRTFAIPPQLAHHTQIAIRLQTSHPYPYFAYNWFWNHTTSW